MANGDVADNLRNTFDLLPRKEIQSLLICSRKVIKKHLLLILFYTLYLCVNQN
jgi:hypothetical protein